VVATKNGDVAPVAVVIVNKDAGKLLDRTLTALERQTVAPRRVLVVDNASTDGSVDGLEERFPRVEVERLADNRGFAGGNNHGVALAADCEWVALLNPDAFAEPDWLEALLRATKAHPEFSFFGSRLVDVTATDRLDGTGDVYHVSGLAWRRDHGRSVGDNEPGAGEIFSPCAAAALYRRDAFLEVGGFDEAFFCYFEDTDLSFRLRLRGHRCLYVPDSVVHHVGSATTGRLSDFTIYHSLRNHVWAWAKNMPRPLVWRYLGHHLLANVMMMSVFVANGQARPVFAAKRDALRGLPRVVRERRAIQAERTVSLDQLRRIMDRGFGSYFTGLQRAIRLKVLRRRGRL
jgi:GT2 family glycosyltransferase